MFINKTMKTALVNTASDIILNANDVEGLAVAIHLSGLGRRIEDGDEARAELDQVILKPAPAGLMDDVILAMEKKLSLKKYYFSQGIPDRFDRELYRFPAKGELGYEEWVSRKAEAREAHQLLYCQPEQVQETCKTITEGQKSGKLDVVENSVYTNKNGVTNYCVKARSKTKRRSDVSDLDQLDAKIAAKRATLEAEANKAEAESS